MAILAGLVMPSANPSIHDQLKSAARIMAADLAYARSLAVTYGSNYRIRFDQIENQYILEHSGASAALDTLPDSPFRDPNAPANQLVVDLDELPQMGPPVRLAAVASYGNLNGPVDHVEFGPLGETTRSDSTIIWLSAGEGPARRFIRLNVNPTTGLTSIGAYTGYGPPAWAVEVAEQTASP